MTVHYDMFQVTIKGVFCAFIILNGCSLDRVIVRSESENTKAGDCLVCCNDRYFTLDSDVVTGGPEDHTPSPTLWQTVKKCPPSKSKNAPSA